MCRSRNFCQGGGSKPDGQETACTGFFLVLNLFYSLQMGSNGFITEKTYTFPRIWGVQLFPGGAVQMLISIETHITCDFPGGFGPPFHPLWIGTWSHSRITLPHYMYKLSILLPWICHNGMLCSIFLLLSGIILDI